VTWTDRIQRLLAAGEEASLLCGRDVRRHAAAMNRLARRRGFLAKEAVGP